MVPVLAAFAIAAPPKATLDAGAVRVPLAISSWCWGARCGAPIARSAKTAAVATGTLVTVELRFVPRRVQLAVAGKRLTTVTHGREVSWQARRGGGVTLTATGGRGWVTYVGRIRLR
ncbi:MAG TPA: hypothetical protein VFI04_00720 [Gaiellaceae bacterium]|nr:hypothetical protein [Gaiellaceae bacterium]